MKTINLIYFLLGLVLITSCEPAFLLKEQSRKLSDYSYVSYDLPNKLEEISGLEKIENEFYGFNDSGGAAEIYKFTSKNPIEITQTIKLSNASNVDWEEMAISDKHLFVGDFGNNLGMRRDLKVYYFPRKSINTSLKEQSVVVDTIEFFYPEQEDYSKQVYNHNFDLESMVYFNEKLHLFTKEWGSFKTKHYTIDLVKGKQPAWLVEDYDLKFLATGTDVIELNDSYARLGMVGYTTDGDVYLMLTDFKSSAKEWLNNPKTIIHLGEAGDVGQVEGIAFFNQNNVCYSAEAITWEDKSRKQNLTCISLK